jgi:hypothetical protein
MNLAIRAALMVSISASLLCSHAFAGPVEDILQPQLGTLWVKYSPIFRDGNLTGCSLEYGSFIRDNMYKQGGFVNLGGSVGVIISNNELDVMLKVVINDLNIESFKLAPDAPEAAYLLSDLKSSKDAYVDSTVSDTPGGLFTIFSNDPTFEMLLDGFRKDEIGISYRRKGGVSDVTFTIDPTVIETDDKGKRTHSPAQANAFKECVGKVINNLEKSSGQKK